MYDKLKSKVKDFWEQEVCGVRYGNGTDGIEFYKKTQDARYQLEPYIEDFAKFPHSPGMRVLEVGVGAGVDFSQWVLYSDCAVGMDMSEKAVNYTEKRLELTGKPDARYLLTVGDAENLPFKSSYFDLVYSWGVVHHSPDTKKCFQEIFRALKPGGMLRAMIYHEPSWVGMMLGLRYGLLAGNVTMTSKEAVYKYLESPGTKVYTVDEAYALIRDVGFVDVNCQAKLSPGDLLTIKPSEKYQSLLYRLIWRMYPRWLVKLLGNRLGLNLLIEARKPEIED